MARRTKEDAQATRSNLLDAAERLFHVKGVSRTSLADIATEAGTTRGAIYWHFKDKGDLFNAMMERVKLPLEEACRLHDDNPDIAPLERLRDNMVRVLHKIVHDEWTLRVFEIAMHKVEYVDELSNVQERHLSACDEFRDTLRQDIEASAHAQGAVLRMPAAEAAVGLHALFDGLLQNWILDRRFDIESVGRATMDAYLCGLGLRLPAPAHC